MRDAVDRFYHAEYHKRQDQEVQDRLDELPVGVKRTASMDL